MGTNRSNSSWSTPRISDSTGWSSPTTMRSTNRGAPPTSRAEYGLIGIPGVEVSTRHGHLLAIGVEKRPDPGQPFMGDRRDRPRPGRGGDRPHPFQRSRHGVRKRHIDDADAIETYNSMVFTGYRNRRARTFASRRDYPQIGASDAHYLPNVGKAFTRSHRDTRHGGPDEGRYRRRRTHRGHPRGADQIRGKRTPIRKSAVQYGKGAVRKTAYMFTSRAPLLPTVPASMDRST